MNRVATAALLAVIAVLGLSTPAWAHNTLIGSTPGDNASVETGPRTIELKFDQPVQKGDDLNSVVVVGPGDGQWQDGKASVNGTVVTIGVRELGPAGVYRIGYRILSDDGHPVSGEVKFTLTKAGTGTPATTAAAAPGDTGTPSNSPGLPVWVWIAGAVVLLACGVVFALRIGAPKR